MSFKRSILIVSLLLTFSCHQAPKPETTSFDTNFEILHGRVKQLQEFYRGGKENGGDTDINDFDIRGNLVKSGGLAGITLFPDMTMIMAQAPKR